MVFCVWQSEQTNTAGDPGKSSCIQREDRKESSRVIRPLAHFRAHQGSPSSGYPSSHTQATQVNTFLSPKKGFPGAMPGSLLSLKPNSDLPTPQTSPPFLRREQKHLHLASSTYYFGCNFKVSHSRKLVFPRDSSLHFHSL